MHGTWIFILKNGRRILSYKRLNTKRYMKKVISNSSELIDWCRCIILDDEFQSKVSGTRVYYWFSNFSFRVEGVLSVNYFDLKDLPMVLKSANSIQFFASKDTLQFRAEFIADRL